jgi:lipooligosaccharide transport system ATP-binding protein
LKEGHNTFVGTAVEIRNLKKSFGDRKAIDGITLEIKRGECFGLLGPNGAGKTTLLRLMSGSSRPQDGELFVLGLPLQSSLLEVKSRVGVVPQGDGLDPELSVRENLLMFATYFGLLVARMETRVHELLRMVALEDRSDELVESLSGGLKRRLAIIRSLLNDPELLILDEPTVALDPQARLWVWEFLREKKREGLTQIITTHYMEEAEALCDRIGLIHKGKLLDLGTPVEVIQRHWGRQVAEFAVERGDASYYSNRLKEKKMDYQLFGDRILVALAEGQTGQDVMNLVQSSRFTLRKPNLNDVFLKLTGFDLQQGGAT